MIRASLPRAGRFGVPVISRNGVIAGAHSTPRPATDAEAKAMISAEDARALILMSLALTPLPRIREQPPTTPSP